MPCETLYTPGLDPPDICLLALVVLLLRAIEVPCLVITVISGWIIVGMALFSITEWMVEHVAERQWEAGNI